MNPVEQLLQQEVTHFVDRLASSVPPDGVTSHVLTTAVRTRLDEAEAQLAQARASLMEGYGRGKAARLAHTHERVEAYEVDRLLEALADFVLDAGIEVVRAVGMPEGHQASIAVSPVDSGTGTRPNVS